MPAAPTGDEPVMAISSLTATSSEQIPETVTTKARLTDQSETKTTHTYNRPTFTLAGISRSAMQMIASGIHVQDWTRGEVMPDENIAIRPSFFDGRRRPDACSPESPVRHSVGGHYVGNV
jgi:hypothetical protein